MINFKKFNSIISLTAYFTSDDKCKQAIVESRWGVGAEQDVVCPYCGKRHCKQYIDEAVYRWNTRKLSESERFAHMFGKSIGLVRKWSEIRVGLMAA